MMLDLKLEIGEPHSSEDCKCICRLAINGERRGKISLTRAEALRIGRFLEDGSAHSVTNFSIVHLASRQEKRIALGIHHPDDE